MTIESIYHVTGDPDADMMEAKSTLVMEIKRLLAERGAKTQQAAALLIGWPRPDVANLLKGKFRGFSLERINAALHRLESRARLVVHVEYGYSATEVEELGGYEIAEGYQVIDVGGVTVRVHNLADEHVVPALEEEIGLDDLKRMDGLTFA